MHNIIDILGEFDLVAEIALQTQRIYSINIFVLY